MHQMYNDDLQYFHLRGWPGNFCVNYIGAHHDAQPTQGLAICALRSSFDEAD